MLYDKFEATFGYPAKRCFSAPGRTELGGNHTDHQHGRVLAASVDADMTAAASENGLNVIRVQSEGYPLCRIELSDLAVKEEEKGTTAALIRGVAAGFAAKGCTLHGFDAYVTSRVMPGGGLSSSAAFEVLVGRMINAMFFGERLTRVEVAKIGQWAENVYFGKPCGLMDQLASSVGGIISVDFADAGNPVVEEIPFDFEKCGYTMCIVDTGADHAGLTAEYAAIPEELDKVSGFFGKKWLRDVPEREFYEKLSDVRKAAGDRAVLRAMHVYEENRRVLRQAEALKRNDFEAFLRLVSESGRSSWQYLQNVTVPGSAAHQELAFSLAVAEKLLDGRGACRVHGGGFAGTIQAYVANERLDEFKAEMEKLLGAGACHVMRVGK